jgi:probable dihydroxyacetone kinase regulator
MANNVLTKTAIANCMKNLMENHPFSKISVSDICRDCNINRKTFYYHFSDKYELLIWIFETDIISPIIDKYSTFDNFEAAGELVTYLYHHKVFYCKAFEITGPNSIRDYLSKALRPTIGNVFGPDVDTNVLQISDAFTDFVVSALLRWLSHYPVTPPDEFMNQLISAGTVLSIKLSSILHLPSDI